jgi:PleD family two-component response regulator
MSLRVLLVDSDPDETLFLQDALAEIQEGGTWAGWVEMEVLHAPTWADAASILTSLSPRESIDLMLLSLDLEDAQGPQAYRGAKALAPHVPAILVVPANDEDLALQQVRDGAQDFLVVSRIECATLAHAMRNAMERQRLVTSLRSASLTDELTGLPNAAGFAALAERERRMAQRMGCGLMLILAEPLGIEEISAAHGPQKRDLIMIEAADHLRGLAGPADLLGRTSNTRFALAILDTPAESVEAARSRIHLAAADRRMKIGAAILDAEHPVGLDSLFDQAAQDLGAGSGARAASKSFAGRPTGPFHHHKTAGMRT